jgi:hypothetical protein
MSDRIMEPLHREPLTQRDLFSVAVGMRPSQLLMSVGAQGCRLGVCGLVALGAAEPGGRAASLVLARRRRRRRGDGHGSERPAHGWRAGSEVPCAGAPGRRAHAAWAREHPERHPGQLLGGDGAAALGGGGGCRGLLAAGVVVAGEATHRVIARRLCTGYRPHAQCIARRLLPDRGETWPLLIARLCFT